MRPTLNWSKIFVITYCVFHSLKAALLFSNICISKTAFYTKNWHFKTPQKATFAPFPLKISASSHKNLQISCTFYTKIWTFNETKHMPQLSDYTKSNIQRSGKINSLSHVIDLIKVQTFFSFSKNHLPKIQTFSQRL